MIDAKNTYLLVEDSNNIVYRMPLETLADVIVMNNMENDAVNNLIASIYELSTYLLDMSADFVAEHFSNEELSSNFELLSETDNLLIDSTILTENDVYKYIGDKDLILRDDVEEKYDQEDTDAGNVFDAVANEADNYFM